MNQGTRRMDADTENPANIEISQLIDKDLAGYRQLKELLAEERQLLVKRDFDSFTTLLGSKQTLLAALAQINQHRCKLLLDNHLSLDKAGIDTLIAAQAEPLASQTQVKWRRVNELIDQCVRRNDINARIAHRAQTTTHQILNILRGESSGFELYGKNGASKDRSGSLLFHAKIFGQLPA